MRFSEAPQRCALWACLRGDSVTVSLWCCVYAVVALELGYTAAQQRAALSPPSFRLPQPLTALLQISDNEDDGDNSTSRGFDHRLIEIPEEVAPSPMGDLQVSALLNCCLRSFLRLSSRPLLRWITLVRCLSRWMGYQLVWEHLVLLVQIVR